MVHSQLHAQLCIMVHQLYKTISYMCMCYIYGVFCRLWYMYYLQNYDHIAMAQKTKAFVKPLKVLDKPLKAKN